MLKKLLTIALLSSFCLAKKDIPITDVIEIEISKDESIVFDFPFKITSAKPTAFIKRVKKSKKEKILPAVPKVSSTPRPPFKGRIDKKKQKGVKGVLNFKVGENVVEMVPTVLGKTELIIWGFSHPIMIKLKVVESKGLEKYYRFFDISVKREVASSFENDSHERVIMKLIKHLYNEHPPSGYETKTINKEYKTKSDLYFYGLQKYVGKNYTGESWKVVNLGKKIKLSNSSFLNTGIYGVSLQNKVLDNNESTRLFIIKRKNVKD